MQSSGIILTNTQWCWWPLFHGKFKKGNTQGVRFAKSTGQPIVDDEEEIEEII